MPERGTFVGVYRAIEVSDNALADLEAYLYEPGAERKTRRGHVLVGGMKVVQSGGKEKIKSLRRFQVRG